MLKKTLLIATTAAALAAGTFCTSAEAADPLAGALVGGGIGAAVGGGPGAAVGAVIGTIAAAADEQYYYDRYGRRAYYEGPPARYYEPARARYYEPAPARYYERAYYAPPPVYYPRPVYYAPPVFFGPAVVVGFGGHRHHHRRW